ncbi:MAG: hypothetical protein AAB930_02235, partial [Patescibacteria group bacterium]
MNKKAIISLVVALASIGGYLYFSTTSEDPSSGVVPNVLDSIKETVTGRPGTGNWLTHQDPQQAFSVKYPANYEVGNQGDGTIFIPPELKGISEQPKTLNELPLGVIMPPGKTYGDIREEIDEMVKYAEYSEETAKKTLDINGIELKVGPNPGGGDNLHKLFNIIPYRGGALIFFTYAVSKEQLEKEGV